MSPASLAAQPDAAERFERLYRACRDDLFAYAATLLHDRDAAEEVTAQTFERAFRKRRSFQRSRGAERAWLFGIARNAALDELRRRRRLAPVLAEPVDPDQPDPAEEAEVALRRTAVRAALAALPPRERELIGLKFHAGLTNAEIAVVLGVSESNAGTLVHRAMTRLRRSLDATG